MDRKDLSVLVVDDAENMRQMVTDILAELDITKVFQAEDGQEALETLRIPNIAIDLVILDWIMPRMSGIELLREIRSDPALANQRVLMLTVEAEKKKLIEAIKLRVDGYILKPVTLAKLDEKINLIL